MTDLDFQRFYEYWQNQYINYYYHIKQLQQTSQSPSGKFGFMTKRLQRAA
jgi:hypothetical protein